MTDKARLRRQHIDRRQALSEAERARCSAAICQHVAAYLGREPAARVGLYLPIRGEVDLTGLQGLLTGPLGLPVIDASGRGMHFRAWQPGAALTANRFGILEPQDGEPWSLGPDDLVLVPCVAIDRRGVRLGYGGGFYDMFLAATSARALGVTYAMAFLQDAALDLPREPHDRPLGGVFTEHGFAKTVTC